MSRSPYRNLQFRFGRIRAFAIIGPDFLPCHLMVVRWTPPAPKTLIKWDRSW